MNNQERSEIQEALLSGDISDELWDRLPRGPQQIRQFSIIDGRVDGYEVVLGDLWMSGYDERIQEELNSMDLVDGVYKVSFFPVGEEFGMDSTDHIDVWRIDG